MQWQSSKGHGRRYPRCTAAKCPVLRVVQPQLQPAGACTIARCLPHIKVVGVGGSASRTIGQLWDAELCDNVDMCIMNTDVQELSSTFMPDHDKVLFGSRTTSYMGTQGDMKLGQGGECGASWSLPKPGQDWLLQQSQLSELLISSTLVAAGQQQPSTVPAAVAGSARRTEQNSSIQLGPPEERNGTEQNSSIQPAQSAAYAAAMQEAVDAALIQLISGAFKPYRRLLRAAMHFAAAQESTSEISQALHGADVVLVLAGVYGGTGAGAAPVVAELARQQGAFTVGIASAPSDIHRQKQPAQALQMLDAAADLLITIPSHLHKHGVAAAAGPSATDDAPWPILNCILGLAELLTGAEAIQLDDLQQVLCGGHGAMGFAAAKGPERVTRATFAAMSSPECMARLRSASCVLCFIGGVWELSDAQLDDVHETLRGQCAAAAAIHIRPLLQPGLPAECATVTLVVTGRVADGHDSSGGGPRVAGCDVPEADEGGQGGDEAAVQEDPGQA